MNQATQCEQLKQIFHRIILIIKLAIFMNNYKNLIQYLESK